MKVKVAPSVSGVLSVPHMQMACKANTEIELSDELFKSHDIQSLIQSGLLLTDNPLPPESFVHYKNISNYKLCFSWGQVVAAKSDFKIAQHRINDNDLSSFLKAGYIIDINCVVANKNTNDTQNKDKVEKTKNNNKIVKKTNKKKNSLDKIVTTKKYIEQQNVPSDVIIHEPKVDAIEKEFISATEDAASDKEELSIRFVDQEQKKEKLSKLQKVIEEKNSRIKSK